jgi:hypothetical protein
MDALATLIHNKASFLARISETDRRFLELERLNAERFAQIEKRFETIEAILLRHEQLLQALPEAIRQKIGSRPRSQAEGYCQ